MMNNAPSLYRNIDIILATKHAKERVIEAPFREAFDAKIFVPTDFDTDEFGTFSGEIERKKSAYDTVIDKAKLAIQTYGYNYGIASEGSFGPHPTYHFIPADIELLAFVDLKNDLVIVESDISTETNFAHLDLSSDTNYDAFLKNISFGTHGVIIKDIANDSVIAKGITERQVLDDIIHSAQNEDCHIRLETDMRAMMNPTRMKVIQRLAVKLVNRIQKLCPHCQCPGFGKITVTGNLPCEDCGTQTQLYQSKVVHCIKCKYHNLLPRDDGAVHAEAKYCFYCNP